MQDLWAERAKRLCTARGKEALLAELHAQKPRSAGTHTNNPRIRFNRTIAILHLLIILPHINESDYLCISNS
jgi:hypothetical protein